MPLELSPATDKHPAQAVLIEEDYIVGDYQTVETSGTITSSEKTSLLERLSSLKDAIIIARERANQTPVDQRKVGEVIFKYLHEGIAK
jgi:hypothetical protein